MEADMLRTMAQSMHRAVYAVQLEIEPGRPEVTFMTAPPERCCAFVRERGLLIAGCEPGGQMFTSN